MDVVIGDHSESRRPGGSPMNVAYGLGQLGVPTTFLTSLGRDTDGREISKHLLSANVVVPSVSFLTDRTGTAIARLGREGKASYEFDLSWSMPDPIGIGVPHLVHTGSIASFAAPGADSVEQFIASIRTSTLVSYDPNVRSDSVGERKAGVARFNRFAALSDIVKLSDDDAAWLYPDRSIGYVIDTILEAGPRLVVVTCGERGSQLATADTRVAIDACPATVVDTIGAGDSYMSALISEVLPVGISSLGRRNLFDMGSFAAAAAAITVSRIGAMPPARDEIESILSHNSRLARYDRTFRVSPTNPVES